MAKKSDTCYDADETTAREPYTVHTYEGADNGKRVAVPVAGTSKRGYETNKATPAGSIGATVQRLRVAWHDKA